MNPKAASPDEQVRRRTLSAARALSRHCLQGSIEPPGDKSISHRAALLAAMSVGTTTIDSYLDSEDARATLDAIRALGAEVEERGSTVRVKGIGLRAPQSAKIDFQNASTPMSLSTGWLAGQAGGEWTFTGDDSLKSRPVDRITTPLRKMGAELNCEFGGDYLPMRIVGSRLRGIEEHLQMPSAQVKSCLMFAALLAESPTTIIESIPARDHTERMLGAAGAVLTVEPIDGSRDPAHRDHEATPKKICVEPLDGDLSLAPVSVPGDFSSAAFFLAGAALLPGSEVRTTNVGLNPTRTGLLRILKRMGADVEIDHQKDVGGEPVGDVIVRHSELVGTVIEEDEVPSAIDEMPLVALLGCFADGTTVVQGASKLRTKESDRIRGVVDGLKNLGGHIEERDDGFEVTGQKEPFRGGVFAANSDHRLAMLGRVAGLLASEAVEVPEMEVAAVSYPEFEADLGRLLRDA